MIPDRQEDIRPRFHRAKTQHQKHTSKDENENVESDDEDDGSDDDSLTEWNLSKPPDDFVGRIFLENLSVVPTFRKMCCGFLGRIVKYIPRCFVRCSLADPQGNAFSLSVGGK